jgi:hypothetical protein
MGSALADRRQKEKKAAEGLRQVRYLRYWCTRCQGEVLCKPRDRGTDRFAQTNDRCPNCHRRDCLEPTHHMAWIWEPIDEGDDD